MTNGQKMRKLFEEKKLVVAPGCHDALTAKIISYLGFDAVYMTGYGQKLASRVRAGTAPRGGQ